MIRLVLLLLAVGSNSLPAQASEAAKMLFGQSPYDVVAPILAGDPAGNERLSGMIYITNGQFKGVDAAGNIISLSLPSGASIVSSNGTDERIERARVTCGSSPSIVSQSGTWLTSVSSPPANGNCTINIVSGMFSAAPTCTCTSVSGSNNGPCIATTTSYTSTARSFVTYNSGATATNGDIDVICMGPR